MIANHIININETKPIRIFFKFKGCKRLWFRVKIAMFLMWLLDKTNVVKMTIVDGEEA